MGRVQLLNYSGLIGPYTQGMELIVFLAILAVIVTLACTAWLSVWARRNPNPNFDIPDADGSTPREWDHAMK